MKSLFAAALFLVTAFASSHAAVLTFEQDGYSGGGRLAGFLEFTDLSANGRVDAFEISRFEARFTGDTIIPDTVFDVSDVGVFTYDLDGLVGNTTDDFVFLDNGTYELLFKGPWDSTSLVPTTVVRASFDVFTETEEFLRVRTGEIPLPSAALLFSPILLLGAARRRRRDRSPLS